MNIFSFESRLTLSHSCTFMLRLKIQFIGSSLFPVMFAQNCSLNVLKKIILLQFHKMIHQTSKDFNFKRQMGTQNKIGVNVLARDSHCIWQAPWISYFYTKSHLLITWRTHSPELIHCRCNSVSCLVFWHSAVNMEACWHNATAHLKNREQTALYVYR